MLLIEEQNFKLRQNSELYKKIEKLIKYMNDMGIYISSNSPLIIHDEETNEHYYITADCINLRNFPPTQDFDLIYRVEKIIHHIPVVKNGETIYEKFEELF